MTLMMSVSGIRGIVGETMMPAFARQVGAALAGYLGGGTVVLGRDSRPSGPELATAMIDGLTAGGCSVVDLGVVTTPGVALMQRQLRATAGVVITASHNPAPWNGFKFLVGDGHAPDKDAAEAIIAAIRGPVKPVPASGPCGNVRRDDSTHERHVAAVLAIVDREKIAAHGFKVVLDSVNGAGGPAGRRLLDALGCDVVHIGAEPDGAFAHEPEPTAENLGALCERTKAAGAAVGFAQDPDADRLAIVDESGRYIGEEYTLALAARLVLSQRPGLAVANLSTSRMIDDLAAAIDGCSAVRSAVGEANVVAMMKERHAVIGGEGNGGVIDPRVVWVRDSLVAMALVLQLMAEDDRPLSAIVDALPRYHIVKQKFDCPPQRVAGLLARVRKAFADRPCNDTDGVRIDWPEGWVHVRGSNTEPIVRIIAEAGDESAARELIDRVRAVVR